MLLIVAARATDTPMAGQSSYTNVVDGTVFTAGFVPDSTRIYLGEPVFVTFALTNRGELPLRFSHVRNEIFSVSATHTDGRPLPRKYFCWDANGVSNEETVAPGKTYVARILLNERCAFDEAGDYAVICRTDLETMCLAFDHDRRSRRPIILTAFNMNVAPAEPRRISEAIAKWARVVERGGALTEAALALAEINDPQTITPLAALVAKTPGDVTAVTALARYTNDTAADALTVALSGSDFAAQLAGTALIQHHQADRAARKLLPTLTDQDERVRIRSAKAIGWTRSELAFAPLVALLRDERSSVRYAAAEAIGRLRAGGSFAALKNCLTNPDFKLRLSAAGGLMALGLPLQAEWVTPIIRAGGENIRTFYDAIDLLRMYGGSQAASGLASCLRFDDPSVRNGYNMRLIMAIEASPDGPKYTRAWHHDPNRDGTDVELADNRRTLSELRSWLEVRKPPAGRGPLP